MTTDFITTLIPTFKRPELLKRSIKSCLDQSVPNICVLILDNCSSDNTRQVVEEFQSFDSRVQYFCHPKTIRAVENFQYGISQVKTPFFSILSDDDYLLPQFYETALSLLSKYRQAKFFVGSTLDVDAKGRFLNAAAMKWPEKEYFQPVEGTFLQIENYVNWTGALFRKEIGELNLLDLSIQPIDLDFMIRVSAKYPFVFSKHPCACFVHHPLGYSSFSGFKLVWPSYLKIAENIRLLLSEKDWMHAEILLKEYLRSSLFGIGCKSLSLRKFADVSEIVRISFENGIGSKEFKYLQVMSRICEKSSFLLKCYQIILKAYQSQKSWMQSISFCKISNSGNLLKIRKGKLEKMAIPK